MFKTPLREKRKGRKKESAKKKDKPMGTGTEKTTDNAGKKRATFAKMGGKEKAEEQKDIQYKKCMVGFAIRIDKENNTKGGFDKKIIKGLSFLQTYIDQHASFYTIGKDSMLKPIKEKGDMLKYQVTMRNYFSIPNPRDFDNVSQDVGRVIKGSAVMGCTDDQQKYLEEAAGDLWMMNCTIFCKKCQEVDTIATKILIGTPNKIKEEIIKQTMDKELKTLEVKQLLMNKDYRFTRAQTKK
jgi:hypothetical protein